MAKLEAKDGQIQSVSEWKSETMTVKFVRRAINPDGDLGRMELTVGDKTVEMTFAQAVSLAGQIMQRCQKG